jgi:methyltransferase
MTPLVAVLLLVALQRTTELLLAYRNTARLYELGAVEIDRQGYPWLVLLHIGWLAGMALLIPLHTQPSWPLLGAFACLQIGRIWVINSLRARWTTRIIVLQSEPLVRTGPYRYCRHPNYWIVASEIALLPLAFGAVDLAIVFSMINLVLLARRIRLEDRALRSGAVS